MKPAVDQAAGNRQAVWKLRKTESQLLAREPLRVLEFAVVQQDLTRRRLSGETEHQR